MSESLSAIIGETIQPYVLGKKYIVLKVDGRKILRIYPTKQVLVYTWRKYRSKTILESFDINILVKFQKYDDIQWGPLSTEQRLDVLDFIVSKPYEIVLMPEQWTMNCDIHRIILRCFPNLLKESVHEKIAQV